MKTTRRQLLAGAAALAAGSLAPATPAQEAPAAAAPPRFRLSLAAYSFRDLLPRGEKKGVMTLHDLLDKCAEWRLDAFEPTSYYFSSEETAYLHSLKAKAFRLGLAISGTAVGNNFCLPPGEDRDRQMADMKRWIGNAVEIGAPIIRVFAGSKNARADRDTAYGWAVEGLREACDYAGTRGVFLAIENHGYLTESADDVLRLLRAVDNEWFTVNLDTGNFDDDPYGNMAKLAPESLNVQVKAAVKVNGKKETADYPRIAEILRAANYRGYVALEYEEDADPMTAVPDHLAKLRAALDAV
ncbi:MAG: sugar phosphate isomerase/epimerase [Candidatus Hydrogenedens sp.]|nr:sugar phosphate isomerase/epimerase [Candidatus Hydrogenedentota bacterium]NLF57943.1 sugar phosphate isomerase/epimerase [Candidatus Hydrogenedens sp.]